MYRDTKALTKALIHVINNSKFEDDFIDFDELIEILKHLKKICKSQKYIDALMVSTEMHIKKDLQIKNILTQREEDIILLIGNGNSNYHIAQILNISKLTVESHRKNIRKKLKHHKNLDLSVLSFLYATQHRELNGKRHF